MLFFKKKLRKWLYTALDPKTGNTRDVTLVRAKIAIDNVTWVQVPGTKIAHVRIAAFSKGVTEDLVGTLAEIQQQGMTGIVLDLRSDPGGLLDEAVGVTSQFLENGNVLSVKDVQGQTTAVPVEQENVVVDLPVIGVVG